MPAAANLRRTSLTWAIVALGLFATTASSVNGQQATATSPCLQALTTQKTAEAKAPPKKSNNKVLGMIGGGGVGFLAAQRLCKDKTGQEKITCYATAMTAGAAVGGALMNELDKRSQAKLKEASYAAAFSGQPVAVNLDQGCAVVEPVSDIQFQTRQVDIAMAPGIAPPSGVLRALGKPQAAAGRIQVENSAKTSRSGVRALQPNSPTFVMGSVDSGNWLLLGRGSEDEGYVASGYAPAKDWTDRPKATAEARPNGQNVQVTAELPCWNNRTTLRVDGRQDSVETKYCRAPDGSLDTPT